MGTALTASNALKPPYSEDTYRSVLWNVAAVLGSKLRSEETAILRENSEQVDQLMSWRKLWRRMLQCAAMLQCRNGSPECVAQEAKPQIEADIPIILQMCLVLLHLIRTKAKFAI